MARHASVGSLVVLSCIMALGLSGWLGKPTSEISIEEAGARLTIEMPGAIRNGDFYETRIRVRALQDIGKLQIEVSPELWREVTVNSMIPSPESEGFEGGSFRFGFASLDAGNEFLFKIASQINPRLIGKLEGHIRVLDDGRVLADTARTMRVLP